MMRKEKEILGKQKLELEVEEKLLEIRQNKSKTDKGNTQLKFS